MAVVNNSTVRHESNGDTDVERLESLVRDLKAECAKLREALAKAESEREAYRHLFLDEARQRREFEDPDLPTLQAMSAGPVEKL